MAVIAARGAWAVGDWEKMRKYVEHVTENSHDGSLLRAVLAIKEGKEHYEEAEGYINKVCTIFKNVFRVIEYRFCVRDVILEYIHGQIPELIRANHLFVTLLFRKANIFHCRIHMKRT